MYYIIFDLEWNNAYNYKTKKGINEIIEIGAIKLNSKLEIVDSFKQLIKPRLSKKLQSRFKNLTHITAEEIRENGIDFDAAFADFSAWSRGDENIFLSWSKSDLYTLISNYKRFKDTSNIDFMHRYADAQQYCMSFIDSQGNNQISLSNCAEIFDVNIDGTNFHRALEDCMITAACFKKVFDKEKFKGFVYDCTPEYFERLIFKPYFISKKIYGDFNIDEVFLVCPACGEAVKPINDYEFANNTFKTVGKCTKCNKKYWVNVRAKQNFDSIAVSRRLIEVSRKKAKKYK
ncbi:MAG: exonuclease domain-containing protein [Eubacteriales bacterium]|nr:exonuclease domain-containing protein [Eubacteriales bacterium]